MPDAAPPLTADAIAARLLDLLRAHAPRIQWLSREFQEQWLIGIHDRWIAWIAETEGRVEVSLQDQDDRRGQKRIFSIARPEDAAAIFPDFRDLIVWWAGRLTIHRLHRRQTYVVLRAFQDSRGELFQPNQELTLTEASFSPYENVHALHFQNRTLILEDSDPIVENLDQYLRPK